MLQCVRPSTRGLTAPAERPKDRIKHNTQIFRQVLSEETKDKVSLFLQQPILASVATVRGRVIQMLRTIDFNHEASIVAKKVHLQLACTIEGNRQSYVQMKPAVRIFDRF